MSKFTPIQQHWRWYQNDAAEPTAPLANENAAPYLNSGAIIRLRIEVAETGGKAGSGAVTVEYSTDDSTFTAFGASNAWNYADGLATKGNTITSNLLTGATNKMTYHEDALGSESWALSTSYEMDIAIQPTSTVLPNQVYYFRLKVAGTEVPATGYTHAYLYSQAIFSPSAATAVGSRNHEQSPVNIVPPASGTKTFGYTKLFNWDPGYWTRTNVQDTNTYFAGGCDGYMLLSYITPTTTENFDSLTSWTTSGSVCEIKPAGILHQSNSSTIAAIYSNTWANGGVSNENYCLAAQMKITDWHINDSKAYEGSCALYHRDGVKGALIEAQQSSGGKLAFTFYQTWVETTYTTDTRWHTYEMRRVAAGLTFEGHYNGELMGTGNVFSGASAYTQLDVTATGGDPAEHYINYLYYFNADEPYQTSDGTMESVADDAGYGKVWQSVSWTATTANSTVISVQVKTAGTSGDLANSSYFSATSGAAFSKVQQQRWAKFKITFQGASSGRYTPVLKDFTVTTTNADTNVLMNVISNA